MYNNGFGCYPQDNMDDGINSYFGESDTNFFGDTSNDSFYGEGCGVAGLEDSSLFSESMGFSEVCGSQVINESYGTDYGYTGMFMEAENKFDEPEKSKPKKQGFIQRFLSRRPSTPSGDYFDRNPNLNEIEISDEMREAEESRAKERAEASRDLSDYEKASKAKERHSEATRRMRTAEARGAKAKRAYEKFSDSNNKSTVAKETDGISSSKLRPFMKASDFD
jgi:hypothetical protein